MLFNLFSAFLILLVSSLSYHESFQMPIDLDFGLGEVYLQYDMDMTLNLMTVNKLPLVIGKNYLFIDVKTKSGEAVRIAVAITINGIFSSDQVDQYLMDVSGRTREEVQKRNRSGFLHYLSIGFVAILAALVYRLTFMLGLLSRNRGYAVVAEMEKGQIVPLLEFKREASSTPLLSGAAIGKSLTNSNKE